MESANVPSKIWLATAGSSPKRYGTWRQRSTGARRSRPGPNDRSADWIQAHENGAGFEMSRVRNPKVVEAAAALSEFLGGSHRRTPTLRKHHARMCLLRDVTFALSRSRLGRADVPRVPLWSSRCRQVSLPAPPPDRR